MEESSYPVWSSSYAFQYLQQALVDFLVRDVIVLIGTYSKQEKMLLLQGGPIQERPSPPNFMTIYDPSNNTWTTDDDDWHELGHGWDAGVSGVWKDVLVICEKNTRSPNYLPAGLNITILNLKTGELSLQYNFMPLPSTVGEVVVTSPQSLCGMLHVQDFVMDGYYLSYNMMEHRWMKVVKEFVVLNDHTEARLISSAKSNRLFAFVIPTYYSNADVLFEYDRFAWAERTPALAGLSDGALAIMDKNRIYHIEIKSNSIDNKEDGMGQIFGQQYDMDQDKWTCMPTFISKDINIGLEATGSIVDRHIILSVAHLSLGGQKRIIVKYNLQTNTGWELIAPMQQLFGIGDILAVTI